LCAALLLALGAPATLAQEATATAESATAARELQERVNGHRPLRANPPLEREPRDPTEPFAVYPEARPFSVVPRDDALTYYPCENCHGAMPVNETRRELLSPHLKTLDHGAGRIWCLECHAGENRNALHTLAGEELEFNEAYMVCGQCHYQPQKDWFFGAHGKRVGTWQGERELYNCTHCHDPHAPAVRPRAPEPPPPLRRGLEAMPPHGAEHGAESGEEGDHE
jgi:uncharacterized CHY-type Zn-finger protein